MEKVNKNVFLKFHIIELPFKTTNLTFKLLKIKLYSNTNFVQQ